MRARGAPGKDLQLVRKEDPKAPLFTSPPSGAFPGDVSVRPPLCGRSSGRRAPHSAGAAETSPAPAAAPGASPSGRPGPHRKRAECLPGWARQGSGRAASSRSPSSNGGASGDAAVRGPRARPEPLTPGRHAAPAPTAPSPRAPGRPLRFLAAGPAPLGPWGFACCRAMGTLHASKPPPRSAPRPGAQRPVPRSSPGISGHGPGAGEGGSAGRRHLLARPAAPGRAPGGGFTRAGAGAAWSRAGSAPGFPRCGGRAPGSEVGTDAARGPPSPAAPTG